MKLILLVLAVNLTGCAAMYNSQDPCQNFYNKPNYQYPGYCSSAPSKAYITRDYQTGRYLTITK